MAWRDLAERLDRAVVRAFDYGGVSFQKMNGEAAVGAPAPLPAEFDGNFVSLDMNDGSQVSTASKVLFVHYGDLPAGVTIEAGDRFILASGHAAGTYEVDDAEPNGDLTGAVVRLKLLTRD